MKKTVSLLCTVAMLLGVIAITGSAATAAPGVSVPENILGNSYESQSFIDFETDLTVSPSSSGRCTYEYVSEGSASGRAIKLTDGSDTSEVYIQWGNTTDFTGFDGILFYADISGLVISKNNASGVAIRLYPEGSSGGNDYSWTRNTDKDSSGSVLDLEIKAYYLKDGEWNRCDESIRNGERNQVPAGFKGWLYIPFTSYVSRVAGNNNTVSPVPGLKSYSINKIELLTGPSTKNGGSTIIFDEIKLVKLEAGAAALPEITASISDSASDGKIDHLYLNAAISASETREVGIIFSDTEASCEAGAKPLFIRVAEEGHGKSANGFIQSGCYGGHVITAANLGGEEGDSVIAVYWQEMPTALGTIYARTFAKNSDGTYEYGAIATIVLEDGVSVLPIE